MGKPPMRRAGWYDVALTAIEKLARRQRFITSDDVWDELGDDHPAPHYNAMGAVMNEAISQGTIKQTSRCTRSTRPNARGRQIQIHESTLFADVSTVEGYIRQHNDGAQTTMDLGA